MDQLKNLSIRKTIVLYMALSLVICFFVSAFIMRIATEIQNNIWWKYVDQEEYFAIAEGKIAANMEEVSGGNLADSWLRPIDGAKYMTDVPRPNSYEMEPLDYYVSEICDFLQTFTVLILSIVGSIAAVYFFYKQKLKYPIEELELASQRIGENNLDFHIVYEKGDEMGDLCREFERMRGQLADNNQKLWKTIEEEKALRAAIAHDIRSPLSVLKGYQEMLMEYLPNGTIDTNQAVGMLKESTKQIERMELFVTTMQKISSLETRELTSEEIRGEQLKKEIQEELDVLEGKFEICCILKNVAGDDSFFGDKEVILEVAENLLSNALRYAKKQIELVVSVTSKEIRICVKDDGVGFQEDQGEVTKLFYQQNIKDSLKHTGLGLYISRLYCEKHGGQLLLENGEDGGAVITAVFCRIA